MRRLAFAMLAACGGHAGTSADAVTAPPGTWTFVDVPGMVCGDGSPTGIGLDLQPGSTDLLVYFEGGGACWDVTSCFVVRSAINIDTPYDAAAFAADEPTYATSPLFDRTDSANPFANATFVFVPYCTGDLHAGAAMQTYTALGQTKTVHFAGATNAQAMVDSLHATLPALTRLWITGSSAGGYGATLDHHRFVAAWPDAQVHILQDSGIFVEPEVNYGTWQQQWSLQFPPGCSACAASFPAVIDAITAANPASRIGLLTYNDDSVIKTYFGYPATAGSITPAINTLIATQYALPTTHVFELAGTTHTMLGQVATITAPGGIALAAWIDQWATGDAAWATVTP